jgi:BolA protein
VDNENRINEIRRRLETTFTPEALEIIDDSHKHAGHAGAKSGMGHFDVMIVAVAFAGQGLLQRHRMIYAALGELMQTDIHALSISAHSPDEI